MAKWISADKQKLTVTLECKSIDGVSRLLNFFSENGTEESVKKEKITSVDSFYRNMSNHDLLDVLGEILALEKGKVLGFDDSSGFRKVEEEIKKINGEDSYVTALVIIGIKNEASNRFLSLFNS